MNKIAVELNEVLKGTVADRLFSDLGRRFYFPKGIVAQSVEAGQKATTYNATIGMATDGKDPIYLPSIQKFITGLSVSEVYSYAPTPGLPKLRTAWKKEMEKKNPSLKGKLTSSPLVTSGLTHAIQTAADLFVDKGDKLVIPDMFWGNYRLQFEERREAEIVTFPFFDDKGGINLRGLEKALRSAGKKMVLILNFPNNPTGYSPTQGEADAITGLLKKLADEGNNILCIFDDAYFGLFYEEKTCKESLFSPLADMHENILAVKVDGATKEEFVWGFRIGFITYASKGMTAEQYEALQKKTMGAIRSSISNSNHMGQSMLLRSLDDPDYAAEKRKRFEILEERYRKVRQVVDALDSDSPLHALPFNSGYFMTFKTDVDAEKLRLYLLDEYGVGGIAINPDHFRVAYSSVRTNDVEDLYRILDKAAREIG